MGKWLGEGGDRVFVTMHKLPDTTFRSMLKKGRDVATSALLRTLIHPSA
jgi:hypothetical protein